MKLEQLSIADLIALRQELHERILGCYKDMGAKKKNGLSSVALHMMAIDYSQKFDKVKEELDRRISIIEF